MDSACFVGKNVDTIVTHTTRADKVVVLLFSLFSAVDFLSFSRSSSPASLLSSRRLPSSSPSLATRERARALSLPSSCQITTASAAVSHLVLSFSPS